MPANAPINKFDLFKDVSEETLAKIEKISSEQTYARGDLVFKEGEEASDLHFLISGAISLHVRLTSRPESVTVSVVKNPYESFGWSGVVAPFHYTATAECTEDATVLTIPGAKLMEILKADPQSGFLVMQRITEIIASRLRTSRQALLKTL
ncbi:MAG: hypothetical protein Kow002_09960 [Anaerolineales bacterium]